MFSSMVPPNNKVSCGTKPDLLPVAGHLYVADVFAVDQNLSCNRIVKAVQQLHQRGLAGAAGSDQCHHLTRLYADVKTLENFLIFPVMEVQILDFNFPCDGRHGRCVGSIFYFGLGVQDFKDAFAGTKSFLDARIQSRKAAHGSGDDHGVKDKGDHFSGAERAGDDFPSAVPQQCQRREKGDETDHGTEEG